MPGPIVSGLASLVIPGLGQILNRRYKRGIVLFIGLGFIVVAFPILMMIAGPLPGMLVAIIYVIAVSFDAYKIAKGAVSTV